LKQIKTNQNTRERRLWKNLCGNPFESRKMAESSVMTDDAKMAATTTTTTTTTTYQSFSVLQSRKFLLPATKGTDTVSASADIDVDVNVVNVDIVNEHKRSTMRRLAKLCPSMDLILVQSTNSSSSSSSLVIYRSLSWQRVADITLPELLPLGDTTTTETAGIDHNTPLISYCWSPNGQCVAVALESSIFLYGVESLVTASGAGSGGGATSGSSSNTTWTIDLLGEQEHNNRQQQQQQHPGSSIDVLALHWVHVGKNHPTAAFPSATEEEQEASWR
jgi:hypothetical protein